MGIFSLFKFDFPSLPTLSKFFSLPQLKKALLSQKKGENLSKKSSRKGLIDKYLLHTHILPLSFTRGFCHVRRDEGCDKEFM